MREFGWIFGGPLHWYFLVIMISALMFAIYAGLKVLFGSRWWQEVERKGGDFEVETRDR
jgi:hypothetical protein